MSGFSQISGKAKNRYRLYGCPNHSSRYGKKCSTKNINAKYLENAVKLIIADHINNRIVHNNLLSKALNKAQTELNGKISQCDRAVKKLQIEVKHYLKSAAMVSGELKQEYEKLANDTLNNIIIIRNEIAEHTCSLHHLDNVKSILQGNLQLSVNEIFPTSKDTRVIFNTYIKAIYIDELNDDIEVVFKI